MYIFKILNISFVNFLASYFLAEIKKSKITYYMYYKCIINILIKFTDYISLVIIGSHENFYTLVILTNPFWSKVLGSLEYYLSLELHVF